jgi:hypothetical protein
VQVFFGLSPSPPGLFVPFWNLKLFNTCHLEVVWLIRNVLTLLCVAFIVGAISNGHLSPVCSILVTNDGSRLLHRRCPMVDNTCKSRLRSLCFLKIQLSILLGVRLTAKFMHVFWRHGSSCAHVWHSWRRSKISIVVEILKWLDFVLQLNWWALIEYICLPAVFGVSNALIAGPSLETQNAHKFVSLFLSLFKFVVILWMGPVCAILCLVTWNHVTKESNVTLITLGRELAVAYLVVGRNWNGVDRRIVLREELVVIF